ncbi:chemotaxis protein CheB [Thiocystis violacea]|uniref:chemotaxis protein CheB n=1 Tax=Thiocystis violacea TaxID=13725 RepID=UPI001908491F|nr:chemotaxis protein CheB [Thiocystis violacea]MBK1721778.1 hypothetical protein [Thiocystis violacea]
MKRAKQPSKPSAEFHPTLEPTPPLFVVGVGASAGGLEALRPMLNAMQPTGHIALIVAQHMSPQHRSLLVELLAKECPLQVVEATQNMTIRPDTVYVCPPDRDIRVSEGFLRLTKPQSGVGPKPSVDALLSSLAQDVGEHSVGVILSGTGSDGAHGCRAVRAAGGITIAQDPKTAKYDGMPNAAIRSETVDLVLAPKEIALQLPGIVNAPPPKIATDGNGDSPAEVSMPALLDRVYKATQVDFNNYKEATLSRQLQRRLAALRMNSLESYFQHIDANPKELEVLQRSFLVSVTSFFRDPDTFAALEGVIEEILSHKKPGDAVRVWVPGCATGEEPYTLAIMLAEKLGRSLHQHDIKIFGTDIDMAAAEIARRGIYPEPALEAMNPALLQRYFVQESRTYKVTKMIRDLCVFARQDLVRDPPFLKMDLISCRNLMIYLESNLQDQLINNFHYSLKPGGYLLLGNSESVGTNGAKLFAAVDGKQRIYKRQAGVSARSLLIGDLAKIAKDLPQARKRTRSVKEMRADAMNHALLDAYAPPSVLLNGAYEPLQFFGEVSPYLKLPDGAADFNMLSMALTELRTELRAFLHRLGKEPGQRITHILRLTLKGQPLQLRLTALTLWLESTGENAILLSFETMAIKDGASDSEAVVMADQDEDANLRLAELEDELAGTREHLQAVIEELETSNEELQSLNEELQASTEELQASNEELETTNEELQATNEELTTVNDELQLKSQELTEANQTLSNIQKSINLGLIVIDQDLRLVRYTPQVVRLFGILDDDIGQRLVRLPCRVALPDFEQLLRGVIDSGTPAHRELLHDEGSYLLTVNPFRTDYGTIAGAILTFSDITELAQSKRQLQDAEQRFRLIAESLRAVIWMATPDLKRMLYLSPMYEDVWQRPSTDAKEDAASFFAGIHPEDRPMLLKHLDAARRQKTPWSLQYRVQREDGSTRTLADLGICVRDAQGKPEYLIGSAVDISGQVKMSAELAVSEQRFRSIFAHASVGMALAQPDGHLLDANRFLCDWLGYSNAHLKTMFFQDLVHPEDINRDRDLYEDVIQGRRAHYQADKRYLTRNQGIAWGRLNLSYIPASEQSEGVAIAVIQDISEEKRVERDVFEQANFDPLTKLPNRNLLRDRLVEHIKSVQRHGTEIYLLFIDLDGFKQVNDSLGHKVGDEVLRQAAQFLQRCVRASDTVARIGGDEFIILVSDANHFGAVERICADIVTNIGREVPIEGDLSLGASVGIATAPTDSSDPDELIQKADTAMYAIKRTGGRGFSLFSEKMNALVQARIQIKEALHGAVERSELRLYFQPIFNVAAHRFDKAEVLLRWQHSTRGLLAPGDFLQAAEGCELIEEIEQWIFKRVAGFMQRQGEHLQGLTSLNINVSARTLQSPSMNALVRGYRELMPKLVFELTEQTYLQSDETTSSLLQLIRRLGGRVSIDDFGAGASDLSYLRQHPVDVIKIDPSFVHTISAADTKAAILDALAGLAMAIAPETVFEGVESEAQQDYLARFPGVWLQGFLLAKPMPEEAFLAFAGAAQSTEH